MSFAPNGAIVSAQIPQRLLYSIRELCQLVHISPATAWRRIGEFDVRRIGRRTFVTAASIERFLNELPRDRQP
jgi:hypothetical protein